MIKIIDYGMGNLRNVVRGFEKVGYQAEITRANSEIKQADGVVLPGVGAFGDAMDNLKKFGLVTPIKEVVARETPFLGICLGLQLLFTTSEEFGSVDGLDIISGHVKRFPEDLPYKVPHMGWNQLQFKKTVPVYDGLEEDVFQYFVHSYYVVPEDKSVIATTTDYGVGFVSSIVQNNIYALQWHPEKSSRQGLKILENFGKIIDKTRKNT